MARKAQAREKSVRFDSGSFLARLHGGTTTTRYDANRKVFGQGDPSRAVFFLSYLLSRNLRIEEDLVDQLFNSSEKRLARLLLLLAHFGKKGRTEKVVPRVSQETLAGMIGTTRARVSHFMNKFRKLGFIEYDGELSIHSSLVNVILHD